MTYLNLVAFAGLALVILWVAKFIFDIITPDFDEDHEIVENSHMSAGIRRSGLLLGVALAISAALTGGYHGLLIDMKEIAIYGLLAVVMMLITLKLNDKVLFPKRNNDKAIANDNQAVAWAEFGSLVSTGIIAFAAFAGEGTVVSAMVFFALGQIALILVTVIYEAFNHKFSFNNEICDNLVQYTDHSKVTGNQQYTHSVYPLE